MEHLFSRLLRLSTEWPDLVAHFVYVFAMLDYLQLILKCGALQLYHFCLDGQGYELSLPAATRTASLHERKACGVSASWAAVRPTLIARASSWIISAA